MILAGAWGEMEKENHHNHPSYNIIGEFNPETRRFIYLKAKVKDETGKEFEGYVTYCGRRLASLNIFKGKEEAFFLYSEDGEYDESVNEAFYLIYPNGVPKEKITFAVKVYDRPNFLDIPEKLTLEFNLND